MIYSSKSERMASIFFHFDQREKSLNSRIFSTIRFLASLEMTILDSFRVFVQALITINLHNYEPVTKRSFNSIYDEKQPSRLISLILLRTDVAIINLSAGSL